jgi:MinD-like ATPase involved in chromosome partitioning or flagellar assembly
VPTTGDLPAVIDAAVMRRLQRALDSQLTPYTMATVSLKGGVGKTTVAACLALTLARYRPDRVVAVDANLHAGTLADRLLPAATGATVQHLLDDLLDDAVRIESVGDIDRYVQRADRLSVLAGHHDPSVGAGFAGDDYAELISTLGRFFHLLTLDCGTGLADDAMRALLDHTDTLILVATYGADAATLAEKTLDWLTGHGYPHLVANCIAVLSHPNPTIHSRSAQRTVQSRFLGLCRTVIDIPSDAALAPGAAIHLDLLGADTRTAFMSLAAAVIDAAPMTTTVRGRSRGARPGPESTLDQRGER